MSTTSARGPGREVLDDVATAQQYVLDLQVLFYSLKTVVSNAQRTAEAAAQGSVSAPCAVDDTGGNVRNHNNNPSASSTPSKPPMDTNTLLQQQIEELKQLLEAERRERTRLQEQFDQAAAMLRKSYGQIVDDYLFATEQLHERTRQLEGLLGGAVAAGRSPPADSELFPSSSAALSTSADLQGPWCSADSSGLQPASLTSPGMEPPHDRPRQPTAQSMSVPPMIQAEYRIPEGNAESCFASSMDAAATAVGAGRENFLSAPGATSGGHNGLVTVVAGAARDHAASEGSAGHTFRSDQPRPDHDLQQHRWRGPGQTTGPESLEPVVPSIATPTHMEPPSTLPRTALAAAPLPHAFVLPEHGLQKHPAGSLGMQQCGAEKTSAASPRARHQSLERTKMDPAVGQEATPFASYDSGVAGQQHDDLQQKKQGARASTRAQLPKDAAATLVHEGTALGPRHTITQWTVGSPPAAARQSPAASTLGAESDVSTPPLRPSPSGGRGAPFVTSSTSTFSAAAARNPIGAAQSLLTLPLHKEESQTRERSFADSGTLRQSAADWNQLSALRGPAGTATASTTFATEAGISSSIAASAPYGGEVFRSAARERMIEATVPQQQQQQPDARSAPASANRNAAAILEAAGRSAQAAARAAAAKAARAVAGLSPPGQGPWGSIPSHRPDEGPKGIGREAAGGGAPADGTSAVAYSGGPRGTSGGSQQRVDKGGQRSSAAGGAAATAATAGSPAAPGRAHSAKRLRRSASSAADGTSPSSSKARASARQEIQPAAHGVEATRQQLPGRRILMGPSPRPVPPAEPPSNVVVRAVVSATEQQVLGSGAVLARGRSLRYAQSVPDSATAREEAPLPEPPPDPLGTASGPAARVPTPLWLNSSDVKGLESAGGTAAPGDEQSTAVTGRGKPQGSVQLDASRVKVEVEAFLRRARVHSPNAAAACPPGGPPNAQERTNPLDAPGGGRGSGAAGLLAAEDPGDRPAAMNAVGNDAAAAAATADGGCRLSVGDGSSRASSSASLEGLASLVRGLRERLAGLQQEYNVGGGDGDDETEDAEGGWQTDDDVELVGGVAFTSQFGVDDDEEEDGDDEDKGDGVDDGRHDNADDDDGDDADTYDRAFSNSYTSSTHNGPPCYGVDGIEDISPVAADYGGDRRRSNGFAPYHNPYGSVDSSGSATPRAHSYATSPAGSYEPQRGLHPGGSLAGVGAVAGNTFSPRSARRSGDCRPHGPSLLDTVNASTLGHTFGGASTGSRNVSNGSSAPTASARGPSPRFPVPADSTTATWGGGGMATWTGGGSAQHDRVAPPDQTSPRKASVGGLSSRATKVAPHWKEAEVGVEAGATAEGAAVDSGMHSASVTDDKMASLQGLRSEAMFARIKQQLDDLQNSFAQGLGLGLGTTRSGGTGAGGREPSRQTGSGVGAGHGAVSCRTDAGGAGGRGDVGSGGLGLWRLGADGALGVAAANVEDKNLDAAERIDNELREARTA